MASTGSVLIVGCGYVGCALARRLVEQGRTVWGLRRGAGGLPEGVRGITADISRPETLHGLPEADAVVLAASPSGGSEGYEAVYVTGLRQLLARLDPQRTPRVLMTSTTGVYHQRDGGWVDEASPTTPDFEGAQHTLRGEAMLIESPFSGVVLRLGGIYGPGRTRLLDQARAGQAPTYADATHYTNRIHRDDCAGALLHLLDLEDPAPLYVGVDDEPAGRNDVVEWLADATNAPAPPSVAYSSASPRARRSNKRCSNERLKASGYRFLYPSFREGYGEMIEDQAREASGAPITCV